MGNADTSRRDVCVRERQRERDSHRGAGRLSRAAFPGPKRQGRQAGPSARYHQGWGGAGGSEAGALSLWHGRSRWGGGEGGAADRRIDADDERLLREDLRRRLRYLLIMMLMHVVSCHDVTMSCHCVLF